MVIDVRNQFIWISAFCSFQWGILAGLLFFFLGEITVLPIRGMIHRSDSSWFRIYSLVSWWDNNEWVFSYDYQITPCNVRRYNYLVINHPTSRDIVDMMRGWFALENLLTSQKHSFESPVPSSYVKLYRMTYQERSFSNGKENNCCFGLAPIGYNFT